MDFKALKHSELVLRAKGYNNLADHLELVMKEGENTIRIERKEAEMLYDFFQHTFIHERKYREVHIFIEKLKVFLNIQGPLYDQNRRGLRWQKEKEDFTEE